MNSATYNTRGAVLQNAILMAILAVLLSVPVQAGDKSSLSAIDRVTIEQVERTHRQLESWGTRLVTKIEQNKNPRLSDPVIDGRYGLYVKKLRLNLASKAQSPHLAAAIRQLADTHERRLRELQRTLHGGVDQRKFAESTGHANQAMTQIRNDL